MLSWLLGKKDWNVIAIMFETREVYRVNGNRCKGEEATKARDGARRHERTIFWAVFDQKRAFLEGDAGAGQTMIPPDVVERIKRDLPKLQTVQTVLAVLERGESKGISKQLVWSGYPPKAPHPGDD